VSDGSRVIWRLGQDLSRAYYGERDGTVDFGGLRHGDRPRWLGERSEVYGLGGLNRSVNFTAWCFCVRHPGGWNLRRRCRWRPHCGEWQASSGSAVVPSTRAGTPLSSELRPKVWWQTTPIQVILLTTARSVWIVPWESSDVWNWFVLHSAIRLVCMQPAEAGCWLARVLFRFLLFSLWLIVFSSVHYLPMPMKQSKYYWSSLQSCSFTVAILMSFLAEFSISKVLSWCSTQKCQQTFERISCVWQQRIF
jgi:hypothetical protein